MTRTLDFTLQHSETLPTGQIEVMDMAHIDRAVVNKVAEVLSRIAIPRLLNWAARPAKEKIMLGEFDSPKRFLIALSKQKVNTNQLPAVYVTREPGIAFADITSSGVKDLTNVDRVLDDADQTIAHIDTSALALTYAVNFVGWNDADIEPLVTLFMMWLRRSGEDKTITVKTKLAGAEIATNGYFSDGPLTTAASAAMPYEQDKLRSLSVSLTVEVDYLQARYVSEYTVTTDFTLNAAGSD